MQEPLTWQNSDHLISGKPKIKEPYLFGKTSLKRQNKKEAKSHSFRIFASSFHLIHAFYPPFYKDLKVAVHEDIQQN